MFGCICRHFLEKELKHHFVVTCDLMCHLVALTSSTRNKKVHSSLECNNISQDFPRCQKWSKSPAHVVTSCWRTSVCTWKLKKFRLVSHGYFYGFVLQIRACSPPPPYTPKIPSFPINCHCCPGERARTRNMSYFSEAERPVVSRASAAGQDKPTRSSWRWTDVQVVITP